MEQYMLAGKINPVSGIFMLKNNFDYTDKHEIIAGSVDPMMDGLRSADSIIRELTDEEIAQLEALQRSEPDNRG